ncbi:hypothetical protein WJX75_003092 [Coccomyxa subellipsoidea]|uniref:Uncharacterized protein n=1 Tax=Coccomyxa subellipsoidea TaxID=248742 RepID=A0ABR2Z293_9CHLO
MGEQHHGDRLDFVHSQVAILYFHSKASGDEIGQGAPVPASLVQAGFILFYCVRSSTALQLHLLAWWSSIIMEIGRWIEGASAGKCIN